MLKFYINNFMALAQVFFALFAACALIAILLFYVLTIAGLLTTDAPFVPVPRETLDDIVRNLKLSKGSVVYDLGCGDGRVLRAAVEACPEIRAVGIEKSLIPYLIARFKTRNYGDIEIRREDFFSADISDATHVYLYLFPTVTTRLLQKIKRDCRPGTRVVSCDFMPETELPSETINLGRGERRLGKALFIYET